MVSKPNEMRQVLRTDEQSTGSGQAQKSNDRSPEQIRADIARTRAEMSSTLEVIQERLDPQRIKTQAQDAVREATIGRAKEMANEVSYRAKKASSNVVATIKQNPIPAAMMAVGLGWLVVQSSTKTASVPEGYEMRAYPARAGRYPYEGYPGQMYREQDLRAQGRVRQYPSETQSKAGETLSQVREKAGETISEAQEKIGEKLEEVQQQAGERISQVQHQATEVGSTVIDTIRRNPIPSAMIALGVGWLVQSSSKRATVSQRYESYNYPYSAGRYPYEGYPGQMRGEPSTREGVQSKVRSFTSETQQRAGEKLGQAQEQAGEMISDVQERAGELVSSAQEQVQHVGEQAQMQYRRAKGQFETLMDERPLVVGAAALAIGALVGLALPRTEPESRLMGGARDQLMERAQEQAQETMEKVRHVAEETAESAKQTAKEEAKNEGLTS